MTGSVGLKFKLVKVELDVVIPDPDVLIKPLTELSAPEASDPALRMIFPLTVAELRSRSTAVREPRFVSNFENEKVEFEVCKVGVALKVDVAAVELPATAPSMARPMIADLIKVFIFLGLVVWDLI